MEYFEPESIMSKWIAFFRHLLEWQLPHDLTAQVQDKECIKIRGKKIQWKLKGTAAKITFKLFTKYGNPKFVDKDQASFGALFQKTYS